MVQYNVTIIIAGAIKGTYHDKVFQAPGLGHWQIGDGLQMLLFFDKVILILLLSYLQEYLNSYSKKRTCST